MDECGLFLQFQETPWVVLDARMALWNLLRSPSNNMQPLAVSLMFLTQSKHHIYPTKSISPKYARNCTGKLQKQIEHMWNEITGKQSSLAPGPLKKKHSVLVLPREAPNAGPGPAM